MSLVRLASGRTVFDTGKVKVGLRAPPRTNDPGVSAETIQTLMLARRTPCKVRPIAKPLAWRISDFIVSLWSKT